MEKLFFILGLFIAFNCFSQSKKDFDYENYPKSAKNCYSNNIPDRYVKIIDSERKSIYIDSCTLDENNSIVKVWVLTIHKTLDSKIDYVNGVIKNIIKEGHDEKKIPFNYTNYSHSLNLIAINCKTKKMRVMVGVDYNINGTVIVRNDFEKEKKMGWVDITPESLGAALVYSLCD